LIASHEEPGGWWTPARWRGLLVTALLVHALVAVTTPISGDEAYYWDCSRHPDWSYFDQPPLVIWLMALFRALFGETVLAVRSPALLSGLLIGLFMLPLARRLGGGVREAAWAYVLLHAMPLFFLGSAYVSTDILMIALYVGATWSAVALAQGERRGWWGFGLFAGLGFLAKFPMVAVLAVMLPLLLLPGVRAQLRSATPWLAGLLSLVLTGPVWIWAARHDWVNITFQLGRVPDTAAITHRYVSEFIGANLLLATPFLGIAMAIAWWGARGRDEPGWRVFRWAVAAPLVGFGLLSLRGPIAGHWGAPGLVLATLLLIFQPFRGRRVWIAAGVVTGILISSLALTVVGLSGELVVRGRGDTGLLSRLPTEELNALLGDDQIVAELKRQRRPDELVASESYSLVHLYAFRTAGALPIYLADVDRGMHGLASLYWYRPERFVGRDFLIVTERERIREPLHELCSELQELPPVVVRHGGVSVREVHLFRCRELKSAAGVFSRL